MHLFAGTRTARLLPAAVTLRDIFLSAIGATIVRTPGQYFFARTLPASPSDTIFSASAVL